MYKIEFKDFFTYSFSLDCVIFGFQNGKIHVLLIKRAMEPFKNKWAIPGDLVYPDEDLTTAANRILVELTSLSNVDLHQAETFGNPDRHPQGRVITSVYMALIRISDFKATASSWAEEVKWQPIDELDELAFDHNLIIKSTYELLKKKMRNEPICFDMLPERFTLNELQSLYEFVYVTIFDKANFRKMLKYIPLIKQTEKQENVKHRPAKLFSFDRLLFQELNAQSDYRFKL
jgi:8-oxo-dGTP diphosphatase